MFDRCSIGVRLVFDPSTIEPCANQLPINSQSIADSDRINSGSSADVRMEKGSEEVDTVVVKGISIS